MDSLPLEAAASAKEVDKVDEILLKTTTLPMQKKMKGVEERDEEDQSCRKERQSIIEVKQKLVITYGINLIFLSAPKLRRRRSRPIHI